MRGSSSDKRPPWGDEPPDSPWTDHHESLRRVWFQSEGINPAAGDVGRAVQAAARHNSFHPVRDYFDALVWDGVPRLDTWLIDYFHAEDSPYIRAIGPRYLISSVARIYQPGCKVDHMLVLEGPQGKQKSEALRTLAVNDAWFTDRLSHVASKDAAQETAGVLIIEIAEMDALTRATPSAMKSFMTRRSDRFRPPYGKHPITLRGSACSPAPSTRPRRRYLRDQTGARRFWPVACRGMIDLAGLEAARDQLWAEAVHRFKAGASHGGSRPRSSKRWRPPSRRCASSSMPGRDRSSSGWGTAPTSASRRCSSTCSGSLRSSARSAAEIRVAKILKRTGWDSKSVGRERRKERENRYWREPFPVKS